MVAERTELTIAAGREADFEAAAAQGLPLIEGAHGAQNVKLLRGIESPSTYMLLVEWNSVHEHVAFTKTEPFAKFAALVRPFYADAPVVAHLETAGAGSHQHVTGT